MPYQFPPLIETSSRNGSIQTITRGLDETSTTNLINNVHAAYNTNVVDLLLSAWGYAFCKLTGGDTASVMLEGHGRETEIIGDVDFEDDGQIAAGALGDDDNGIDDEDGLTTGLDTLHLKAGESPKIEIEAFNNTGRRTSK